MLDALAWYLALQAAALAVWPLVARSLECLDDRGWAISKVVGLVALAWLVWFPAMLLPLPYTRLTIALVLVALAVAAWGWLRWTLGPGALSVARLFPGHLRGPSTQAIDQRPLRGPGLRMLIAWEVLFAAAFALFALLRVYEPAVAGTEKPMDMAFLNAFLAASKLPTQDTWLAGYGVPYYYFGYFVFATLGKLSGTAPAPGVAYNLAAATVPSLALLGFASLGWNLSRSANVSTRWSALGATLAGAFTIFAGNLTAALEFLVSRGILTRETGLALDIKNFAEGVVQGVWPPAGAWWWRASRVVPNIQPDGINEVPFFSILLSDLHPHFLALAFESFVLAAIATHWLSRGRTLLSPWAQAASALALGTLLVANTWDIAPFWLLYLGLTFLAVHQARADLGLSLRRRLFLVGAAPLGGIVLFLPYFVGYQGPPLGLGIVETRTPLGSFLAIFGAQVVLLVAIGLWSRWRAADRTAWGITLGGVVFGFLLLVFGQPTLGLLVALAALTLPLPVVFVRLIPAESLALCLAAFAVAMLLGVELIFLRDAFGTRMNTVFKFHYNAWVLSGLAGAVGVALIAASARLRDWIRWATLALVGILLLAGLVYPLSAINTRLAHRPPNGPTLDGTAFLAQDEAAVVRWLAEQARAASERPVVAEAVSGQYSHGARMATYSGAASVVGWIGHELQWRGPLPELSQREGDLNRLYRDADSTRVAPILQRYGVDYVVVGDLEREKYGPGVTTRFEGILPLAYRSGRVLVYRAP